MFRCIRAISYCVDNLAASRRACERHFAYRTVYAGEITAQLAQAWNAPLCAGQSYCVLEPASGEQVMLRFIEAPKQAGYEPLKTLGWNAAELHVQDVYALAAQLSDSPYQLIGGPRDLLDDGTVIALQVRGPSDEVFYLTQLSGAAMQDVYGRAEAFVGRVFIAVLGVRNHEQARAFYAPFCSEVTPASNFQIRVLANAHGLNPLTTTFAIASGQFRDQFRIELDAYPDSAKPRPCPAGHLPAGLAMVSIEIDELNADLISELQWRSRPDIPPYHGARAAMLLGPNNEWLELIEGRANGP